MNLKEFNALVGQESYVRCSGKQRIDTAIVDTKRAEQHIFSGGTIGWWVKEGYIVVDIDEGKEEARAMIKALGIKTLVCETNKGLHVYFKTNKLYPQKIGMILPGGLKCDYRCANKGYVLLPYGAEGRKFNRVKEIAEMPLEMTPMPDRKDSLLGLKDGDGRNSAIFAHLLAYRRKGANEAMIKQMAMVINDTVFTEAMEEKELMQIARNVMKEEYAEIDNGGNPYLTYNSKGAANGVNYREIREYFVNRGDLFVLNGECYTFRDGVYTEASSYVRNSIGEMIDDPRQLTQAKIMETYRLIIDDTRLQKEATDLNSDTNLINFKNGVWDINAEELLPHDSKYLQTIQLPHTVNEASIRDWEQTRLYKFLSEKVELDEENINMIVQYMAYCLTLDFGLKTFMVLQGQSNTGKSVLIRFFENLVGRENTSALSMHELNMRFYPAQLYSRLLNSCADNSSLPLSSIENLKKITGGDLIMHEKKGKEPFFFVPFAKLLFSFNQLPLQLEEKSNAFYLRMRILHMNKQLQLNNEFVNALCSDESIAEAIPHLLARLPIKEVPRTATSDKLIESMRQDSDSVHAFITDRCEVGKTKWVSKKGFYESYVKFCLDAGREPHKKHSFFRHIRDAGFKELRHPQSRDYCWRGIGIKK